MKSILNEDTALGSMLKVLSDLDLKYNGEKSRTAERIKKDKENKYIGSSISSYTKNLVMSFPVLFDDTLSLETAQTIAKANERNIVTMLQMLFNSINADGAEYLGKFHKNINEATTVEEVMDAIDEVVESSDFERDPVFKARVNDAIREMVAELKQPKKRFPISSFSERSLNDYRVSSRFGRITVRETTAREDREAQAYKEAKALQEDANTELLGLSDPITGAAAKTSFDKEKEETRKKERKEDKAEKRREREEDIARADRREEREKQKEFASLARAQVMDSDIKKANELQPTVMIVNKNIVDNTGSITGQQSFVAGVKCRLINTPAIDIVERLVAKNKSKLSFKNLLRATTGEIRLVKDFLLCVKQAKINAKNAVKKGDAAILWNAIERRSNKNTYNAISRTSNDATAITTLVINQETANYMKSMYNLDINKPSEAKSMMQEYNLLCLVIADDSIEAAKFLYDGNNEFEVVSYSGLNRDNKEDSYRKALNTMSRR